MVDENGPTAKNISTIVDINNAVYPATSDNIKEFADIESCKERLSDRKKGIREEGNFTLGCLKLFHTRTR